MSDPVVSDRKDVFWRDEATVASYVEVGRQAIPLGNEQTDAMLRTVAAFRCPTRAVLDLGAGDGVAAEAVARRFPVERVTMVDFSAPMLERAGKRFAGSLLAVDIVEADLYDPGWLDALPADVGEYDVVVSRYAIHHLTDARKRELYSEVYERLTPGGVFANIEHVSSASPVYAAIFDDLIIDGMVATSDTVLDRAQAAEAFHNRYDAETNILAPADVQCDWLRDVGFVDVDVVMKVFELAVIVARKPIV